MTLAAVKNELNITWSDPKTDARVQSIMARAESVLNDHAGATLDYDTDPNSALCQLYLDCCRYMWNHVFENFETAFSSQLNMLRAQEKVENYVSKSSDEDDSADV